MGEPTPAKGRTQSRCREWEKNRRNKFNVAVARLGEIVKENNKSSSVKEADNVQYSKIEIIEKAIVCLTNYVNEKTQLKSEILSLQVTIETYSKEKQNKRDASTQVFLKINKKKQDEEPEKGVTSQKIKRNVLKKKRIFMSNAAVESKVTKSPSITVTQAPPNSLPMLLPKSSNNKKVRSVSLTTSSGTGTENTIVVLPAAPYILPQRPFLLPTVSPAFVIVDSNVQTLNKPLLNRNNGDITKTTMVNILPISAYSRPLSATKNKKNNKIDISKKVTRKPKQKSKVKVTVVNNETSKTKESESIPTSEVNKENKNTQDCNNVEGSISKVAVSVDITTNNKSDEIPIKTSIPSEAQLKTNENVNSTCDTLEQAIVANKKPAQNDNKIINKMTINEKPNDNNLNKIINNEKIIPVKETIIEDKNKDNKLPILPVETTLCENENAENVDGGNARLELAEEFLAASPTAAFLMSFPLVSGNRADSPADETHSHNTIQTSSKDNISRRNDTPVYFEKSYNKSKHNVPNLKTPNPPNLIVPKENISTNKFSEIGNKVPETKAFSITTTTSSTNENPFLNLPLPSLIPASCGISDSTYGIDFDCNINKSLPQTTNYGSSNNIFYKSDPFNTVKSTIYSTSSISSGHEFNSFGLYPCAMEKYTSKSKNDYTNIEDNLMKIGSSRLTYDIDLGWSHKGFDFVGCTNASSTFNKDMLTTTSGAYSSSYNPFTPDLHTQLTSSSNKKDTTSSKPNTSFSESFTSLYSQPTPNLWSDDVSFYNNNSISKTLPPKHQTNFLPLENIQPNPKPNVLKQYDTKVTNTDSSKNSLLTNQQISEKFTKKSPSKTHINWMTSEIRPIQNNFNTLQDMKNTHKTSYSQPTQNSKKQDSTDNNYFTLPMHNFTSQTTQEELQVWTPARSAGTTEISIDPPPINLPTLVGDLALGPLEKKKNTELSNRSIGQPDLQNCSNFLSVSQLMNRSSGSNISSRYQVPTIESSKTTSNKTNQNPTNDSNRKVTPRVENYLPQSSYVFNDNRVTNSYETMNQYSQPKPKTKQEKNTKGHKNSYSAEALIRGGTCTQKIPDSQTKCMASAQKYNDFSLPQDSSVAQVSHFPPIIDYSDNNFTGQQYSTTLYNSTTNTITNSFYSNFMPGSSNLMSGSYPSGPFPSDYIDYTQADCNYSNHKYEDLKVRNTPHVFQQDKSTLNYKSSRRESTAKHKLECSKKESTNKKYQNKRAKVSTEVEDWNDTSHLIWQNKTPTKRHPNLISEELPFPNYVSNQMPTQYQPDFFNSHLMPSNMQSVGHNVDRSLATFPVTSRANFNLSTIFPEIAMKVQ